MKKISYCTIWRNKWITSHARTIEDFIVTFEQLAIIFKKWKEMGIKLSNDSGIGDDYARFYTSNIDVALKANFVFQFSGDKENYYLDTLSGDFFKVPEDKLSLIKR